MHPIVHQIAKDTAADITIWAPLIGLPTGIYEMVRGDYHVGGTIIFASVLIFALAFWACAHCATEVHSAFWAQKAMITVGLLSAAFLWTQTTLAASIVIIIIIFFMSLKLHENAQTNKEVANES